jgi:hypothetical protein
MTPEILGECQGKDVMLTDPSYSQDTLEVRTENQWSSPGLHV